MRSGVRQAHYSGRTTTRCPLLLAATVADLTLVATTVGLLQGHRRREATDISPLFARPMPLFAIGRAMRPMRWRPGRETAVR